MLTEKGPCNKFCDAELSAAGVGLYSEPYNVSGVKILYGKTAKFRYINGDGD